MILAQRAALIAARAKADNAEAEPRRRALLIDQMKLTIAMLRHERFRQSSERSAALDGTSGTPRRPSPFLRVGLSNWFSISERERVRNAVNSLTSIRNAFTRAG
jgi:hypothetical protein